MSMDLDFIRALMTIVALAAFAGVAWWAYAPSRKERFERDALLPFSGDER